MRASTVRAGAGEVRVIFLVHTRLAGSLCILGRLIFDTAMTADESELSLCGDTEIERSVQRWFITVGVVCCSTRKIMHIYSCNTYPKDSGWREVRCTLRRRFLTQTRM